MVEEVEDVADDKESIRKKYIKYTADTFKANNGNYPSRNCGAPCYSRQITWWSEDEQRLLSGNEYTHKEHEFHTRIDDDLLLAARALNENE